ncbi:MAG: metallophosphoesterase [Bacteroidales bacterium]|nr:metallophosphoesterase [Bacteroidales bacterium]
MKKTQFRLLIIIALIFIVSIPLLYACFSGNNTDPDFGNFHFSSTNTPLSGTTINWSNTTTGIDKIKWGYTASYEKGEFEGVKTSNYGSGYMFSYTFPTLNSNHNIHYRVFNSKSGLWTDDRTFKTSVDTTDTIFSFIAAGDSRTHIDNWKRVSNNMSNVDFVIFTGDIVNNGNIGVDWEMWYANGKNMNKNMVVYHSYGNHDGSIDNYTRQFVQPGNELYYSFEFGNAIFICLDSEKPRNSKQINWLRNTLSAYADKTWKIVFFHKPFYTCGGHAGEMNDHLSTWWKAFDDYGVDLIFNGHAHNYQRTNPINRNVSINGPVADYGSKPGQGRCQVVTGGAGAPIYGVSANSWYNKVQAVNHHCQIDVNGKNLRVRAIKPNGDLIDDFMLTKNSSEAGINVSEINNTDFEIYPNPSSSNFELSVNSEAEEDVIITLYAVNGKTIKQEKLTKKKGVFKTNIGISDIPAGTYYVQVVWDNRLETKSLVIN